MAEKILRWVLPTLLLLALVWGFLVSGLYLYFHRHCRGANTWDLIGGAQLLRDPLREWAVLEPGRLMIRNDHSQALRHYFEIWGWRFSEQLGSGTIFRRDKHPLMVSVYPCGSYYRVAEFHIDPKTGAPLPQR